MKHAHLILPLLTVLPSLSAIAQQAPENHPTDLPALLNQIPGIKATTGQKNAAPTHAAQQLVERVTPEMSGRVMFSIVPGMKEPVISTQNDKLHISGGSTAECIRAYGFYLIRVAGVHLSWNGDYMPEHKFELPKETIKVPAALPFNYAMNYCTLSYTCLHWDKERWEREVDRMALSGYTHMLVTSGLEKVWQNFLRELGASEDIIRGFIPNPAYAAWWNMGNLEGEGGPVSQTLIDSEAELGRFLVHRMRELGMEPVLQGYVGFLPHNWSSPELKEHIIPQGKWCDYPRPSVLRPTCPEFPKMAALWYKHLHEVYGTTAKVYGGDLFHEGGIKKGTPLKEAAQAVQAAMHEASPDSTWLIQAWGHNPDRQLLSGTDPKRTVILALHKDMSTKSPLKRHYAGRPYVWCELSNFGGNHGMFGGFELLSNMSGNADGAIGFGLLSEGLETNPLHYALFHERMNNRGKIDKDFFLYYYALSRYGSPHPKLTKALSILADTVYKPDTIREGCQENIMCARPRLDADRASTWSAPQQYYDYSQLRMAAQLMLEAAQEPGSILPQLDTFRYDLTDICRQVLSDKAREQLPLCKAAYERKDLAAFEKEYNEYLRLIRLNAKVLATNEHFLMGAYLSGAEKRGTTPEDSKALRESLLQLITTWRGDHSLLNDYAHRQFAELMENYYLTRWSVYFSELSRVLKGEASEDDIGVVSVMHNSNNGEKVRVRLIHSPLMDSVERKVQDGTIPMRYTPEGDIMQIAPKVLR